METMDWVKLLQQLGDNVERKGINECDLGDIFPRYAEFWGRFVLPNRSHTDASKLREGFDPEIEDIINAHYSIFFQLTTAYYQIEHIDSPLLDIATPLYHLGAVVDLTERLMVTVIKIRGQLVITKINRDQFLAQAAKYFDETYEAGFNEFIKNYHPAHINLHNIADLFKENISESKEFSAVANDIRHYRNMSIHSLQPIRLNLNNAIHIPKIKSLHKYKNARWSSELKNINNEDFDSSKKVLKTLADRLTRSMNDLWVELIKNIGEIMKTAALSDLISQTPVVNNIDTASGVAYQGGKLPENPSGYQIPSDYTYSGGSITFHIPPNADSKPPIDKP